MNRRLILIRLLVIVLFIGMCALNPPQTIGEEKKLLAKSASVSDPLLTLNTAFIAAYAKAKIKTLADADPIIISQTDTLILLKDGQRLEAQGIPPLYHMLKAIAHIPLALYVTLYSYGDAQLSEPQIAELRHYRELMLAVQGDLNHRGFPAQLLERQKKILVLSQEFIDRVIESRTIKQKELTTFTHNSAALILANSEDAAKAEIDLLHKQVMLWREQMSPQQWQRLHVVVIGAHMMRDGALVMQYFSKLLNETKEGQRIIYAEGLDDEKASLNLLAMHLLNAPAAEAFFGDPERLHRDLFSDAAHEYLQKLAIN